MCVRTVRHWDSGRNRVPWSAVKLLRLLRLGDLGALYPAWDGWKLRPDGDLVSPNGYAFEPWRLTLWPLICEQARFWRQDQARRYAPQARATGRSVPFAPELPNGATPCPRETASGIEPRYM